EGRSHQGSSGVYRTHRDGFPPAYPAHASTGWSGMGIPLPLASRLMRHRVASGATGERERSVYSSVAANLSRSMTLSNVKRRSAARAWISRAGLQPSVQQTRSRLFGDARRVAIVRAVAASATTT